MCKFTLKNKYLHIKKLIFWTPGDQKSSLDFQLWSVFSQKHISSVFVCLFFISFKYVHIQYWCDIILIYYVNNMIRMCMYTYTILLYDIILICYTHYMIRVCVCSCTVKRQSRAGYYIQNLSLNCILYNNLTYCTT